MDLNPQNGFSASGPDSRGNVTIHQSGQSEGPFGQVKLARSKWDRGTLVEVQSLKFYDGEPKGETSRIGLESFILAMIRLYPDIDFITLIREMLAKEEAINTGQRGEGR